jgi:hypothetical protein
VVTGVIRPAADSTSSVQVQTAAGTAIGTFDTANGRFRIAGNSLQIQISTSDLATNGFFSVTSSQMTFYTTNDVPFVVATNNTNAFFVRAGASYDIATVRAAANQTGDYFQLETSGQLVAASFKPVSSSDQRARLLLYNTLEVAPSNYERLAIYADNPNNIFVVDAENAGSGSMRNLRFLPGGALMAIGNITPTALLDLAASTTARASLRIRPGAFPTGANRNDGDIGYVSSGRLMMYRGTTEEIFATGVQATGGAATAGAAYGATEQTMLQAVYDAARNFGLLS